MAFCRAGYLAGNNRRLSLDHIQSDMVMSLFTLLLCIVGIVLVSLPVAFFIKIVAHIPNAKKNADTMYGAYGGSWAAHYINEWKERIQE